MQRLLCCLVLLSLASCESTPPPDPVQAQYGPTIMAKTNGHYTLVNRKLKVEIDEVTGSTSLAMLGSTAPAEPLVPKFEPLADSNPVAGYVESRDDETWQYFGDSKDGRLAWRLVYNLYYDGLNVTYIVQNKTAQPITGYIALPTVKGVSIQPFNESQQFNQPGGLIRSDNLTINPGERKNFATRWTVR